MNTSHHNSMADETPEFMMILVEIRTLNSSWLPAYAHTFDCVTMKLVSWRFEPSQPQEIISGLTRVFGCTIYTSEQSFNLKDSTTTKKTLCHFFKNFFIITMHDYHWNNCGDDSWNEWLGDRVKFAFSPDVILFGWLGSKHHLPN